MIYEERRQALLCFLQRVRTASVVIIK